MDVDEENNLIKWGIGIEKECVFVIDNGETMTINDIINKYDFKIMIDEENPTKETIINELKKGFQNMNKLPKILTRIPLLGWCFANIFIITNTSLDKYNDPINQSYNVDFDKIGQLPEIITPLTKISENILSAVDFIYQKKNNLINKLINFLNGSKYYIPTIMYNKTSDIFPDLRNGRIEKNLYNTSIGNFLMGNDYNAHNIKLPSCSINRFVKFWEDTEMYNERVKNGDTVASKIITNRLGSYHLNLTLPYNVAKFYNEVLKNDDLTDSIKQTLANLMTRYAYNSDIGYHNKNVLKQYEERLNKFMEDEHLNWAKAIQWIEPLLLAVYGIPDPLSINDGHKFTEGSLRILMGNDVGILTCDLEDGFNENRTCIIDINNQSLWINKLPEFVIKKYINIDNTIGSDFRRENVFKFENIHSLYNKKFSQKINENKFVKYFEYMIIPYGFEFRMLDSFDEYELHKILELLFLLAEHITQQNIVVPNAFRDDNVHNMVAEIMKEGWNTRISEEYYYSFYKEFYLPIPITVQYDNPGLKKLPLDITAYDMLNNIYKSLFNMYYVNDRQNTIYIKHVMNYDKSFKKLKNINKQCWEKYARNFHPPTNLLVAQSYSNDEDSEDWYYYQKDHDVEMSGGNFYK